MRASSNTKRTSAPEFRLAAACAWLDERNWSRQRETVLTLLDSGIDPIKFYSLVKRHRIPALSYRVLSRATADAGRELTWLAQLRPGANRSRLQSLKLHAEWQRIHKLCQSDAIGIRTLKGSVLSVSLYGDAGMRHARDLDLFVKPQNLERLLDLLRTSGYEIDCGFRPHRRGLTHRIFRLVNYHVTCKSAAGSTIEVHSHIERPLNSEIDTSWTKFAWSPEPCIQAQFDMLYCTLHGSCHGWSRLKWLGDLRTMVGRMRENEWQDLIEIAAQLRLQNFLAAAMLLLHWVTDFPLPETALDLLETSGEAPCHLANQAISWMTIPEAELNRTTMRNTFRRWQLAWQIDRRLPFRELGVYWLTKLLFSPTDLLAIELPPALLALYPVIRPVSSLRRNFAAMVSKPR